MLDEPLRASFYIKLPFFGRGYFSILCILCHNVQHVFGLHDLRETQSEKEFKPTGSLAAGDDEEYIFRVKLAPSPSVQLTPGISGHETFSNHKNPLLILLHILVPHTHKTTTPWLSMKCPVA